MKFEELIATKGDMSDIDLRFYSEGLISQCWQSWCGFSREIIVSSSLGCMTVGGISTECRVSPATWQRVSYLAICARRKTRPKEDKTNNLVKFEPTWGDINRVQDVIDLIDPSNKETIKNAFSITARGPLHLQLTRNAATHISIDMMSELRAIRTQYNYPVLRHPCDMLFWVDPTSGDFAFRRWVFEMKHISSLATQ